MCQHGSTRHGPLGDDVPSLALVFAAAGVERNFTVVPGELISFGLAHKLFQPREFHLDPFGSWLLHSLVMKARIDSDT